MGRGRAELKRCFYCGRLYPMEKMMRTTKYGFSYHDQQVGLEYRGLPMTVYCCRACSRHRGVRDQRQIDERRRRNPTIRNWKD